DLVYNPLVNGLHGPWNLAAIKAGKHVLSEKPFASNAAEARAVAKTARERGVTAVGAVHHAYHPVMLRMLELAGAELEVLVRGEARFTARARRREGRRCSSPRAGGALMALGCYGLHASRALGRRAGGGEPTVTAATGTERAGVDESMTVELGFPNGATGRV